MLYFDVKIFSFLMFWFLKSEYSGDFLRMLSVFFFSYAQCILYLYYCAISFVIVGASLT